MRPCIYLPADLPDKDKEYILLHERIHIRRGDTFTRAAAFLALCLHWFNPLVWLAFFLSGRDMKMSCDEAVIRQSGGNVKKEYSASLLSLAAGRKVTSGIMPAFGESEPGSRIKNVLRYKKPAFAVAAAALAACVAAAVFLLGNPESPKKGQETAAGSEAESGQETVAEPESLGNEEPWIEEIRKMDGKSLDAMLTEYYELVRTEEADVSDAPGIERIEIYLGDTGDGDSGLMLIYGADGDLLYTGSAHSARAGWANFYAGELDGTSCLLSVHIEDRDDFGEYWYQVFRLGEHGEQRQIAGSDFQWGNNIR